MNAKMSKAHKDKARWRWKMRETPAEVGENAIRTNE